ncbi:proline-specific peptidase [Thozetella sp. PMI_491]|nr:proline-specific peptidase [Thozetella sp. PMI_491]
MEGRIPFKIPGDNDTPCFTYYKAYGNLSSGAPPVVVLHGGPGAGHEYLLSFANLWLQYGIPVVFYDQIGCGSSTHLRQRAGDKAFWQESLFIAELDNLLDFLNLRDGPGFHLLGQSWGGMLAAAFAASQPRGLQRLVLASGLASQELSMQGVKLRRAELPVDIQRVLDKHERDGDYENPAYQEALMVFNKTFLCREDPLPPDLIQAFKNLSEDKTVYGAMNGPSLLVRNGSLLGWTSIPRLPRITAPTLVYNGEYDTSHDIGQIPFFELIPRVRWITFANGSHMCHVEGHLRDRVLKVVGGFLTQESTVSD